MCYYYSGSSNDLLRETKVNRVPGKKGRPRKYPLSSPPKTVKISNKIAEAINNNPGRPILYASTTKGTMKLVVDGHHFRYSFRKGKYTIFQCCYKENKEECLVRVVTDQKLVYPLDGEHIHFVQATDKSVTSVKFSPAEDSEAEPEYVTTADTQEVVRSEPEPDNQLDQATTTVFVEQTMPQPLVTNVIKIEKATAQECLEFTSELVNTTSLADDNKSSEAKTVTELTDDANEFREKIKKRLQRALLGKKKQ